MLDILYEEPHFLLINKPSGMFSQSPPGIENVQDTLLEQLAVRDQHAGRPFVGLPHRLDRGTSGVMLLARNQRALKRFGEQFQSRKVSKYYLAVVHGELPLELHRFEDFMRKIPEKPLAEITPEEAEGARHASLSALGVAHGDGQSLAVIELHTGRMHQIRLQFATRGFPVVGDWSYGSSQTFGPIDPEGRRQCLALHALRIEYRHPQTAKLMSCTAPLPELWQSLPMAIQSAAQELVARSRRELSTPWPGPVAT